MTELEPADPLDGIVSIDLGEADAGGYSHLSREELIAEIERKNRDLRERGRYGLRWEMKSEDIEDRLLDAFPRLVHVPELGVDTGVTNDQPTHLLIEGDNLAALNALLATHAGRVSVAVCDPPYFTSSTDFRYNDNFVAKEDAYAHSKWLSFIKRRFELVKKLLSPSGVLFVHIDDNEVAQLKLLLDGVFDEDNFVANFIWRKTETMPNLSRTVRRATEYVLCYAKDKRDLTLRVPYEQPEDETVPLLNAGNAEGVLEFPAGSVEFGFGGTLPAGHLGGSTELLDALELTGGRNIAAFRLRGHFRWSQENLMRELKEGTRIVVKTASFSPRHKKAHHAGTVAPTTLLTKTEGVGTNEDGSKELENIFGRRGVFDYPKAVSLIKYLINTSPDGTDAIILDAFAGSGTTGQAVLEMNVTDGGTRTAVLLTNNENGICREVTRERLRKVMEGYVTPKGKAVAGTGGRLRYLQAFPLPSFDTTPEDPACIPRESALAEASRTGIDALVEIVAVRHAAYSRQTLSGGGTLLTSPTAAVGIAASGRMAAVDELLSAVVSWGGCGTDRHAYFPCRGEDLPTSVTELCARSGVEAHAIPSDVLGRMRYDKPEA